uniref:Uncharacterized protein n=1 Tax=Loa loa TaxID=7209 RepID=A0A1I7VVY0_LOALO
MKALHRSPILIDVEYLWKSGKAESGQEEKRERELTSAGTGRSSGLLHLALEYISEIVVAGVRRNEDFSSSCSTKLPYIST